MRARTMLRSVVILSAFACGMIVASGAQAGLVTANFNDVSAGVLNGKSGGSGWGEAWGASGGEAATATVFAGDLTTALYNVPQSGTSQSVKGPEGTIAGDDNVSRAFADPITGQGWFTYLAWMNDPTSRVGMTLNTTGAYGAGGSRVAFLGNGNLLVTLDGSTVYNLPVGFTLEQTHLLLGKATVDASGTNDRLQLWFDPDLTTIFGTGGSGVLPAANVDDTSANFLGDAWSRVGVHSYGNGVSEGGVIDALRISDGAYAFHDVTGLGPVPEPSVLVLLTTGLLGLLAYAWRKRR